MLMKKRKGVSIDDGRRKRGRRWIFLIQVYYKYWLHYGENIQIRVVSYYYPVGLSGTTRDDKGRQWSTQKSRNEHVWLVPMGNYWQGRSFEFWIFLGGERRERRGGMNQVLGSSIYYYLLTSTYLGEQLKDKFNFILTNKYSSFIPTRYVLFLPPPLHSLPQFGITMGFFSGHPSWALS